MAKQTINIGIVANDGTGDRLRSAMDKCNDNFDELYAASSPDAATENDFQVANSGLSWVAKTLAQVKTILGLGSAAYTDLGDYATASHTQADTTITSTAFQTPSFANPLNVDVMLNKNFVVTITGNTEIGILNAIAGDSGQMLLIISGAGGYTITLNASQFTKKLGSTSIVTTTGTENMISWVRIGSVFYYTIIQVA